MSSKVVDLSMHSLAKARRLMNKIKKDNQTVKLHFKLPAAKTKHTSQQEQVKRISVKCPQCNSQLVSTDDAITCSSSNMKYIVDDIKAAKERYGDSAGLWLGKTAYRFLEQYEQDQDSLRCDFYEAKR